MIEEITFDTNELNIPDDEKIISARLIIGEDSNKLEVTTNKPWWKFWEKPKTYYMTDGISAGI